MVVFHGASASSSSSFLFSSIHQWTYDAFLSFRGDDTRKAFTAHLYAALCQNNINTFMDHKLESGEEISPALLKAIEESEISIIVLSKNYASSRWCLDELIKILECKKTRRQRVLPLFYDIDPSEVRNQTNSVGEAFAKLEGKFKHDQMKLQRWKTALSQVADLSGRCLENRSEPEFIHEIIQLVKSMLVKSTNFQVAQHQKSDEQYVNPLLIEKNDNTCMVGIFKTGGIDESTIAKVIHSSIAALTEEYRKSDRRNQAVRELDSEQNAKELIDSSEFSSGQKGNRNIDRRNQALRALDSEKMAKDLICSENISDTGNQALRGLKYKKFGKALDQFFLFFRKPVKNLIESDEFREKYEHRIQVPFFDWKSILVATNGFLEENKLGQGGFGSVYKGTFPGGEEIVVKRLDLFSRQGEEEFMNEVLTVGKLQHMNIVRLWGYCTKGDERILLYEYMPNKSLDSFIFDQRQSMLLNWEMRINIILGIARGLLYLHRDSRLRIIHRDLKLGNILLDEEMNPKISDFGFATIVGGKETGGNTTRICGTYGYMSPEYVFDGLFSVKSDVFSFGVVLLEIISGKKTQFYQSELAMHLTDYAWRLWVENKVLDLMDPTLHEICNVDQFVKCVNIGLLCIEEDLNDRPTMSNVVTMLDGEGATFPTPKQPAFVQWRGLSSKPSSSSKPDTTYTESTSSTLEMHDNNA
ncbi:G-type lectin S-receptor-like serine/threonine-protein kinase At4g03230 [Corylus avellana]|uniref:G-type lectin S-receptor-like serine/threonine-protein kinase At4g03230 n=1 Tax=Corylus avellana TaxID=13451 RepID=UPI00286A385C|nr:G-type lectin S-receptor-like serine/threonine-protein kinase At4g03230 [Corylus avellana]